MHFCQMRHCLHCSIVVCVLDCFVICIVVGFDVSCVVVCINVSCNSCCLCCSIIVCAVVCGCIVGISIVVICVARVGGESALSCIFVGGEDCVISQMMVRTYSEKQRNSSNYHEEGEGARRELVPPGRQHLVAGVHWMDNGSLTVEELILGGAKSWQ
jgi:hypothetical protein